VSKCYMWFIELMLIIFHKYLFKILEWNISNKVYMLFHMDKIFDIVKFEQTKDELVKENCVRAL